MEEQLRDVSIFVLVINGLVAGFAAGRWVGDGRVLVSNLVIGLICSFICGWLVLGDLLNLALRPSTGFLVHLLLSTICASVPMAVARFMDR